MAKRPKSPGPGDQTGFPSHAFIRQSSFGKDNYAPLRRDAPNTPVLGLRFDPDLNHDPQEEVIPAPVSVPSLRSAPLPAGNARTDPGASHLGIDRTGSAPLVEANHAPRAVNGPTRPSQSPTRDVGVTSPGSDVTRDVTSPQGNHVGHSQNRLPSRDGNNSYVTFSRPSPTGHERHGSARKSASLDQTDDPEMETIINGDYHSASNGTGQNGGSHIANHVRRKSSKKNTSEKTSDLGDPHSVIFSDSATSNASAIDRTGVNVARQDSLVRRGQLAAAAMAVGGAGAGDVEAVPAGCEADPDFPSRNCRRGKAMTDSAASPTPRTEVATSLLNETPLNGCLVLGQRQNTDATYITRYRTDRKLQRHGLCSDTIAEECVPCCHGNAAVSARGSDSGAPSCERRLLRVVSGEAFLVGLHACVIILGVTKESLDLRHQGDDKLEQHFYHSVLEVLLTTMLISIRIASVWSAFSRLKAPVGATEFVTATTSVRGRGLRSLVVAFLVLGGVSVFANLASFVLLQQYAHLGWTVLTNNLAIVSIMATRGLFLQRFSEFRYIANDDQHKVALYESVLLLQEAFILRTPNDRRDYFGRLDRFLNAFGTTTLFNRPRHIHLLKEYVPDWEYYSSGQVITSV